MPLESVTYINDLVATNPTSTDPKSEGDNHLRLIKSAIKATFPNLTGPVTATQNQLNVAVSLSGKNKIINGHFGINQRSYVSGAATTSGQYTLDRWKVTSTGGITFSTTANKTTVTIPSGQTLQQVIEGLTLESGTYVLSWEGTAQGRIAGGSYGASGAVTASITGGTNTTIEFNAGTVTLVMLEKGTVATPFEYRPYAHELALCQRYYWRTPEFSSGKRYGFAACRNSTTAVALIPNPVPMRSAAAVLEQSGTASHYALLAGLTGFSCSSVPAISAESTPLLSSVTFTVISGLTTGQIVEAFPGAASAGYLGFSAEL